MLKSIKDMLGLWHMEENFIVFNDGSLGCGFKIVGNDISLKTPEEINQFSQKIENLLVSIPEDYTLQFFYKLGHKVGRLLEKHDRVSAGCAEKYEPIKKARLSFFRANEASHSYFVPEIYLFVRCPKQSLRKRTLFEKAEKYSELTLAEYTSHRQKFERTLNLIESTLSGASVKPTLLKKEEWFGLIFSYLNFSRGETIGVPSLRDEDTFDHTLSDQVVLSDLIVDKDSVTSGGLKFRVVTLALLPEGNTHSAMIDEFTKLPFHFWICQNVKTLDQKKELGKLELNRRVAHSMASGSKNVSDIESESRLEQIESLIRELHEGSEKIVMMDFNVIIWGVTTEELETKTDEILRAFRSLNQAEGLHETYAGLDAFVSATPVLCKGFRFKKMKSSNAAHLFPLYSCWLGNSRPVCVLPNRENSLFSLDPFAPELPNWNGLVFGGSGAGKSFTVSQLMLQFYGQTPRPIEIALRL